MSSDHRTGARAAAPRALGVLALVAAHLVPGVPGSAGLARADIAPPGQHECEDRHVGEPCRLEDRLDGRCVETTCWRVDPDGGGPAVAFPCVRCRPGATAADAMGARGWRPPPLPEGAKIVGQRFFDEPYRSRALARRAGTEAIAAAGREAALRREVGRQRVLGLLVGAGGTLVAGAFAVVAVALLRRRRREAP